MRIGRERRRKFEKNAHHDDRDSHGVHVQTTAHSRNAAALDNVLHGDKTFKIQAVQLPPE